MNFYSVRFNNIFYKLTIINNLMHDNKGMANSFYKIDFLYINAKFTCLQDCLNAFNTFA